MKKLLLLIACLSAKALIGSSPPPSPRDGANAGAEAFKQRLREIKLTQDLRIDRLLQASEARRQADFEEGVHLPTISEPKELSSQELQAKEDIEALLAILNNPHKCNCDNSKPKPQQNSGPKK